MTMDQTPCQLCEQTNNTEKQLGDIVLALNRLQKQAAPLFKEYMINRSAHPRCANCTILVGKTHLEISLLPEPMIPRAKGQRRYLVCDNCYIDLHKSKMSVPQRRKHNLATEEMLAEEISDDEIEEVVESRE